MVSNITNVPNFRKLPQAWALSPSRIYDLKRSQDNAKICIHFPNESHDKNTCVSHILKDYMATKPRVYADVDLNCYDEERHGSMVL